MRLLSSLFLTSCLSLGATTFHVSKNSGIQGDGRSWKSPASTLQKVLTGVEPGDTILIAEGVYFPIESSRPSAGLFDESFVLRGNITIQGGYSTNGEVRDPILYKTVLSGDILQALSDGNGDGLPEGVTYSSSNHIVRILEPEGPTVLEGLWFANSRNKDTSQSGGCAILAEEGGDLTLIDCHFRYLEVETGGSQGHALHYKRATPSTAGELVFSGCTFVSLGDSSRPYSSGGALYIENDAFRMTDCDFFENEGNFGGSIYFVGNDSEEDVIPPKSTILRCEFKGNFAQFSGGAIFARERLELDVVNSLLSGNHSGQYGFVDGNGGALSLSTRGSLRFINNTIVYNTAGGSIETRAAFGGAIFLSRASYPGFSGLARFENNIFHQNLASSGIGEFPQTVHSTGQRTLRFRSNYSNVEDLPTDDPDLPNHTPFQGSTITAPDFFTPLNLVPTSITTATGQVRIRYHPLSGGYFAFPIDSPLVDLSSNYSLFSTWSDLDLAGQNRSQGNSSDPGAYEAQPPPGTLEIVDITRHPSALRLYFVSDRPVDVQISSDLEDWTPSLFSGQLNITQSPITVQAPLLGRPKRFYRLVHSQNP